MSVDETSLDKLDKLLNPMTKMDRRIQKQARVLVVDIERFPAELVGWQLFNANFGLNQIKHPGGMFSFAAKWTNEKKVHFHSTFHDGKDGMLEAAHNLFSEAEILVGWNSKSFDVPHVQTEFFLAGMNPPSPFRQVDLMQVAKSRFRFLSNKLDFVAQQSGVGAKMGNSGMPLWLACMEDDPKAWATMKRYNIQDVKVTEGVLWRFLPWIKNFPVLGILEVDDMLTCRNCGSSNLTEHHPGWTTGVLIYPKLQCECGAWMRGNKTIGRASATYGI